MPRQLFALTGKGLMYVKIPVQELFWLHKAYNRCALSRKLRPPWEEMVQITFQSQSIRLLTRNEQTATEGSYCLLCFCPVSVTNMHNAIYMCMPMSKEACLWVLIEWQQLLNGNNIKMRESRSEQMKVCQPWYEGLTASIDQRLLNLGYRRKTKKKFRICEWIYW